jgi:hypothetical protein
MSIQDVYLGLDQCNQPVTYSLRRNTYSKVLSQNGDFIQRRGLFLMHNVVTVAGAANASILPWEGGKLLDTLVIPKGSVLDVTNIVYSMRIDPTFPTVYAYDANGPVDANANLAAFSNGVQADDLYLDPSTNRFLVNVNRQTPFSISYTRRSDSVTFILGASGETPPQPPPVEEVNLSRYNGTSVLNRNILTQGDLNFHLIVKEDQVLEFIFQTEAYGTVPIPKAEVEVQWCGRFIPKSVFEEVIKTNR